MRLDPVNFAISHTHAGTQLTGQWEARSTQASLTPVEQHTYESITGSYDSIDLEVTW